MIEMHLYLYLIASCHVFIIISYFFLIDAVEGKRSVVWRDEPNDRTLKSVAKHEIENLFSLPVMRAFPQTPTGSRKSRQLTSICGTPSFGSSNSGGSGTVTKTKKSPFIERPIIENRVSF